MSGRVQIIAVFVSAALMLGYTYANPGPARGSLNLLDAALFSGSAAAPEKSPIRSLSCRFIAGPLSGATVPNTQIPGMKPVPVGSYCKDGRGSLGVALSTLPPEIPTSLTCKFTEGPRAGATDYLPNARPVPIGGGCTDGHGSSGYAVWPTSRPASHPAPECPPDCTLVHFRKTYVEHHADSTSARGFEQHKIAKTSRRTRVPTIGMNATAALNGDTVALQEKLQNLNGTVFCPVLDDRATSYECDYYKDVLRHMTVGAGGVAMPDAMYEGETRIISFAISSDESAASVANFLGSNPKLHVRLKIGRRMATRLDGDGFTIDPVGLQTRDLFIGKGARWDWKVTALKAREHKLLLSAYVVVPGPNNSENPTLLKTLELPLSVRVTWAEWTADRLSSSEMWLTRGTNWLKALRDFLIALFAVIMIVKRKRVFALIQGAVQRLEGRI